MLQRHQNSQIAYAYCFGDYINLQANSRYYDTIAGQVKAQGRVQYLWGHLLSALISLSILATTENKPKLASIIYYLTECDNRILFKTQLVFFLHSFLIYTCWKWFHGLKISSIQFMLSNLKVNVKKQKITLTKSCLPRLWSCT